MKKKIRLQVCQLQLEAQSHMLAENITFKNQLPSTVSSYPNLSIRKDDQGWDFLSGILDIYNDVGIVVGAFMIEIHGSENFPFLFPKLFETGGEIPHEPDWHKNKDGSCCITVLPDEILKCRGGITVNSYIQNYAIPFLANHIHRKKTGKYKNGEYGHNLEGLEQFYVELLRTKNRRLWLRYFNMAFNRMSHGLESNQTCFCGSRTGFGSCHEKIFEKMQLIGEPVILYHFKQLIHEKAIIHRLLKGGN